MQGNLDNQSVRDSCRQFDIAVLTVIGDREEQQDSFGYQIAENDGIIVLCDGMGGHNGGRAASRCAVRTILDLYEMQKTADPIPFLRTATLTANEAVCALKNEKGAPLNGGSTLVAVIIRNQQLFWSSAGDSRAYLCREGQFAQITLDHNYGTVLREQLNVGLITPAQYAEEQSRAGALISFLGMKNLKMIDYNETAIHLQKKDRIILMSDGLYKLVPDDEIRRVLENFQNIGEALSALEMKSRKNAARLQVRRDNLTAALIQIK